MTIPTTAPYPVFRGDGVIEFEERAVPPPGEGQLLLRCRANALCASEMGVYSAGGAGCPGHEAVGVTVAVGPGAATPVGTPGVVFLMDFCGECRSCLSGFTNQCLAKRADYGFTHSGGYGPYMVVNENVFFPIDEDVSPAEATLLLDVMGTGGHTLARGCLVHPDPGSFLVTGAGPIGLGVLAIAKIVFGEETPVIVSDMVPYRLNLAETMGGLPVNLSAESLDEGIKRHGFQTVDMAIDASGKAAARRAAMNVLAKRGVLVCAGHSEGVSLDVSPDLIAPERAVLGSEYFCYSELKENAKRLARHRSYLGQILTHRFPISQIADAFEAFIGQETGKVVVEQ